MSIIDRFWKKWPLWTIIIGFFLFGLLLILLPPLNEWTWDHGVVTEIGIAFLTAGILGGSIHVYLERDIAQDAFEGAIGYFLPPDVKEAVRFISGLEWFAEEFSWTVELDKVDGELVKATMKFRRRLKNITHGSLRIKNWIHIDGWGYRKKSDILECELQTSSRTVKFNQANIKRERSTVYAETEEVTVGAGEYVTLMATGFEYKRLNDALNFSTPYATRDARIIISKAPEDLETWGGFSTNFAKTEKHPHLNEYVVKGFCLPWQLGMVRWWPREQTTPNN